VKAMLFLGTVCNLYPIRIHKNCGYPVSVNPYPHTPDRKL